MSTPVPGEPSEQAAREYRVTWQREGLPKKRRLYQRRDAAEKFVRLLRGESRAAEDPDAFACCSGYDCGCGGVTNAEAWEARYGDMPRLVIGPVLASRPVGDWSEP